MVPLIEQNRDEIARLCRTYHVARLVLFGSAVRGDFDEQTSDLDFSWSLRIWGGRGRSSGIWA
jgi:predicted nucleotidyltransferase